MNTLTLTLTLAGAFAAGVAVGLIIGAVRRRSRAARGRRRITEYLTPRLLNENSRRDASRCAASALPNSFWRGQN